MMSLCIDYIGSYVSLVTFAFVFLTFKKKLLSSGNMYFQLFGILCRFFLVGVVKCY